MKLSNAQNVAELVSLALAEATSHVNPSFFYFSLKMFSSTNALVIVSH